MVNNAVKLSADIVRNIEDAAQTIRALVVVASWTSAVIAKPKKVQSELNSAGKVDVDLRFHSHS